MEKLSLCLLVFIFSLFSCTKSEDDKGAQLQIILWDEVGNPVPGAKTRLYTDGNDPEITVVSDGKGIVLFSNLKDYIIYYWYAE
jgi:hypothetical protein